MERQTIYGLLCRPLLMEDNKFIESADTLEREHGERLGIEGWEKFGVEDEYGPIHDWVADPEGTAILGETSITRRFDFQDWARNRRKAFDTLVEKYERAERGELASYRKLLNWGEAGCRNPIHITLQMSFNRRHRCVRRQERCIE